MGGFLSMFKEMSSFNCSGKLSCRGLGILNTIFSLWYYYIWYLKKYTLTVIGRLWISHRINSKIQSICTVWYFILCEVASLVTQMVKNRPAMQETWVQSLGQKDPLEKGMTTHSSILVCRIPWTEKPVQATVHGVAKSQTRLSDWQLHCVPFKNHDELKEFLRQSLKMREVKINCALLFCWTVL